ncbi:MAG: GNAT family N-acetyltransferase [Candidatus Omnitrophica bacterium]|nr:GNAT family N-acetyltransferase [Candidatus Omnitrophota bacterium]
MTSKNVAVSLVPFTERHLAKTFEWVSDSELQKDFLIRKKPTWDEHLRYFEKALADPGQKVFAIIQNGTHAGNCGLKHIALEKKEGELWIYIGEPAMRKRGLGKKALELLIGLADSRIGLKKLIAHVADFNKAARRLYEQRGFTGSEDAVPEADWQAHNCKVIRMELKI